MLISTFNINKFCGPYSYKGFYYNPRNIDFKTPIKEIVCSLLKNKNDIVFLQEFIDYTVINAKELFPETHYCIYANDLNCKKSNVVAITLANSDWEHINDFKTTDFLNKFIEMKLESQNLTIVSFHNTDTNIENIIQTYFDNKNADIILGDFNNIEWTEKLKTGSFANEYRDLVTDDMITFKPAQTTVDHIFIRKKDEYKNKIVFNGVVQTFSSDHNLLTFSLNL